VATDMSNGVKLLFNVFDGTQVLRNGTQIIIVHNNIIILRAQKIVLLVYCIHTPKQGGVDVRHERNNK
jgi:hypothetical protein